MIPLPVEVIYCILDEVSIGYHERSASNKRRWTTTLLCSTVSRTFREYLLPKIFSKTKCPSRQKLHGLYTLLTRNPRLAPLIKCFHLFQVASHDIEEVWVMDDPYIGLVLRLLLSRGRNLEEFILEICKDGHKNWAWFDKEVQDSIETTILSGKLKVVRFLGVLHIPVSLLQALRSNVETVQLILISGSAAIESLTYLRTDPALSKNMVTQPPRCITLDIGMLNIGALLHFSYAADADHGESAKPSLRNLILRHNHPVFIQNLNLMHVQTALRLCTNLEKLSIIHETSNPLAISSFYMVLKARGFLLCDTSIRHVEILLPLHYSLGLYTTLQAFPGCIHELFRPQSTPSHYNSKYPSKTESLLETVTVKIALATIMMLDWARSTPSVIPRALEASDWSLFEKELCSVRTYPRLRRCTIDLRDFSDIGIDVGQCGAEEILRGKLLGLVKRGVECEVVF